MFSRQRGGDSAGGGAQCSLPCFNWATSATIMCKRGSTTYLLLEALLHHPELLCAAVVFDIRQ